MKLTSAARSASLRCDPLTVLHSSAIRHVFLMSALLLLSGMAFAVPTPVNDSATVQEDSAGNVIDVASNDGGGAIASTAVLATGGQASNGTAVSNGNGTFNYTPNADYFGADSFTYQICDLLAECATATVNITVDNVPDAPVANPDTDTVNEDSNNNVINVTGNDTDADGDAVSVTAATVDNGTVGVQNNSSVNYAPDPDFFGTANVSYTITDGNGGFDNSTLTITVSPLPDNPIANNDTDSVLEDSANNPIDVLANDTDVDGDTLTVSAASASFGTATANGTNVLYTPNPNYAGQDTINYTVSDGTGRSDNATVAVTVTNQNDPPVANNDIATVAEDSINNLIDVLDNDTDPDGDTPTVTAASASSGTAVPNGPGTAVIYTPLADFVGQATINYTISDGNGGSDSAIVTVTVSNENDPPVANNDVATVDEDSTNNLIDVTANDTDADGDTLTVTAASATNGTVTPSGGSVSYTPNPDYNGPDTINYTIVDGNGGTDNAVVSVTVTPQPDAPVANDDTASVEEDSVGNVIPVAANDTDVDGDTLTVSAASAANGTATPSGGSVSYTPNADYFGPDTINYTISDGNGGTDTAIVSVTVGAVVDAPIAVDDAPPAIDEGSAILGTFNVLTNDTNLETGAMTAVLVSPPANAIAFTLNPDGTFNYTHDGSETPSDSFTYQADNGELSNVATVTITINPVNDAPSFVAVVPPSPNPVPPCDQIDPGELCVAEDTTLTIVIADLIIDDPDNVPTDLILTLDPVLPPDADYTLAGAAAVTPNENFNGQLNVRATVSDGQLDSAPFLIPVQVDAVNDLPVLDVPAGPQIAIEDALFELDVFGNFSDADGDVLTFSATGLPASNAITIDPVTGLISGTPTIQDTRDNDPYIVIVTAQDPSGDFANDTIELTVSALDRANLALAIDVSSDSALPNDQLRWTFTSSNPVGPAPGQNVELSGMFVGSGLTVAVAGGANCTITVQGGGADFVCPVGGLPVGGTAAIEFTTTASQATEVIAFATTAGAQRVPIDPNIADNSAVKAIGVAESFSMGAVQTLGNSTIRDVAAGDVNGDGLPDLVVGTSAGEPVQIFLGDIPRESCQCVRDFVSTPISVPDNGANEGVALADFDGNGSLDLVIANGGGQPDVVYGNDGAGNFTLMATLADSNGRDVAVGDFNGDGDLDVAVAANSPNPIYFGDGAGGFIAQPSLGDAVSAGVAVGRFDGDTRDDLVFANVGTDSQVWLSGGGGGLAPGQLLQYGDAASVAAADLNSDGLDDIVLGRVPVGVGDIPENPVLMNQGGAAFGAPAAMLGLSPTNQVLVGDVNEDGMLDLVFVNASGVHQIWTATGAGFTLHTQQIIDSGAVAGVLTDLGFADSNDPGGVDLAMGGDPAAGLGVYLNDSAGNLGLGDAVPPVITLNGAPSVDVPSGGAYSDAGATAVDNIDGEVTPVATSNVNTAVVGSYTVTYNVTDFAGNAAVPVSRTVNVTPAVGRGGGGGGALDYWVIALFVGVNLLFLVRARIRVQKCKIKNKRRRRGKLR